MPNTKHIIETIRHTEITDDWSFHMNTNSLTEQLKKHAASGNGYSYAKAIDELFELEKIDTGKQINTDEQEKKADQE